MSEVKMTACDHCGKRVDNPCAERGWIRLDGHIAGAVSVARYTGEYARGSYQCDYLQRVTDFCSLVCFVAALDQKARERTDKEAQEKEGLKSLKVNPS